MRRFNIVPILAFLALVTASTACDGDPTGPPARITQLPRALTSAELSVIQGSNAFALDLLREVRAVQPDSPNTFLSPLSASMALGMTLNGAGGDTWTQMSDALGFAGLSEQEINEAYRGLIDLLLALDPSVELGLGNAIWTDAGTALLDDFVDRTETYFDAEVSALDFSSANAADVMNGWVEEVTRGRIERLIETIPANVVMYLINAVYFKGDWRHQFERSRTAPAPFTRSDGTIVTVDMMEGEVGYRVLRGGSAGQARGVELPYGGDAFSAVAILPPEGQSIDAFVAGMDGSAWADWMSRFDDAAAMEDTEHEGMLVRLPKFEIEWGDSLMAPLEAMGMVDAFSPLLADLSRIRGTHDLYIDYVIQKTYLKVDEEGTEAAAATAVAIGETSAPPSLSFDRPFVFAIRERHSGSILFMGVIGDPSA